MFGPASWDEGLDETQLEAASHGDGPLVIAAGAGTGKTRALTARVAYLLDRGIPPDRILLLTFTRRAADDMIARATRLAGLQGNERPHGGTFHAIAHRHVSAYAEVLELPKGFSVLNPADACDLMDLLRGNHALVGTETRVPRSASLVEIYSRCINNQTPLKRLVPAEYPWCEPHVDAMADLFREYTDRKRRSALLDFDDLLLGWQALLHDSHVGRHIADRYSHVLVDEYQDMNLLQVDIVRNLAPGGAGLTVVGDEAQAIYGFRGSDPSHLRGLVDSFPDASIVRLEVNFRSRQPVLDVANAIRPAGTEPIKLISDRGSGAMPRLLRCHDAPSEARTITDSILDAHERGVPLRDQAILIRAAHHSDLIEVELSARKVPYRKYGGLRFMEAAHVRDFIAAGRLLDNSSDEVAWYRVLRLHRHIGPARARQILAGLGPSYADALDRWPELVAACPPQARGQLSVTLGGLATARERSTARGQVEGVLEVVRPLVAERYGDARSRQEDLERLAGAASEVDDLPAWLSELTLDPALSSSDRAGPPHLDEDYVVISTIHSAKGLEWPIVHVPQVLDGSLPSDMALRTKDGLLEEQRLLYVAVTRARDELFLYAPFRMPHHRRSLDDRHSYAKVSRFLDAKVLSVLDVVEEDRHRSAIPPAYRDRRVAINVDALWN
jgi:DNA helicase-2/ATP-dependent DNA helicase PcrA